MGEVENPDVVVLIDETHMTMKKRTEAGSRVAPQLGTQQ